MKSKCKYCGKEIIVSDNDMNFVNAHKTDTQSELDVDYDTDISPYSCEIVSRPSHNIGGEYSGDINNLFSEYVTDMCSNCSKELDKHLIIKIKEWAKLKGVNL